MNEHNEHPTQQIDVPPTTAIPVQPSTPASPAMPAKPRKRWPIVVGVIVALALIAGTIGGIVYANKHTQALTTCRSAVARFSQARKDLLDTTDQSPAVQQLIRKALGVDKILDAVSNAATSAEDTVENQGCAPNATITQLSLVANTLNSATDSLQQSTAQILKKQHTEQEDSSDSSNAEDNNSFDDVSQGLDAARSGLQSSLQHAQELLHTIRAQYDNSPLSGQIQSALEHAIDGAQKLIDDSGIKDSKLYKAAQGSLDKALSAAQQWVDKQAAQAQ